MNLHISDVLCSNNLLQSAAERYIRSLNQSPNDIEVMSHLGEIYRKLGLLENAAKIYQEICLISPDNTRSRYLYSLLSGSGPSKWPETEDNFTPVPFVIMKNFFPHDEHQYLLSYIKDIETEFKPSLVLSGYSPDINNADAYYLQNDYYSIIHKRLMDLLPTLFYMLQIFPFTPGDVDLEIKAYRHGRHFKPHSDKFPGKSRRVNFGCILYYSPCRFSGGDFLLFDTDFDREAYCQTRFTRIIPEDNCAIFYSSDAFHSVVPVKGSNMNFLDSRFSIVGHIEELI